MSCKFYNIDMLALYRKKFANSSLGHIRNMLIVFIFEAHIKQDEKVLSIALLGRCRIFARVEITENYMKSLKNTYLPVI